MNEIDPRLYKQERICKAVASSASRFTDEFSAEQVERIVSVYKEVSSDVTYCTRRLSGLALEMALDRTLRDEVEEKIGHLLK